MSQVHNPILSSENIATTPAASNPAPAPPSGSISKPRSCVVCRTRKVRCDKQSPCSNCRRANITCNFPSTDRAPRWARRRELFADNAIATSNAPARIMERVQYLEALVKDLSGQLEQAKAHAATSPKADGPPEGNSSDSTSDVQRQFGRLVLQDANQSRYVSSGFWSRVNDEIDVEGLDSDTSEDEASSKKSPSTQELERTPSQRHAFLIGHNLILSVPDLSEFHPLPSQIPFLLDVYSENINVLFSIIHVPTVTKMIRELRNDMTSLTPANEALMFAIYYSAITSMEEDDIMTNFGCTKIDLNHKYRLGLEYALAKADFLNVPNLVLVQAFTIFLSLLRRHDSPRYVWMMTGLLIRMAHSLGLQRDGTHFENLTPYEIEMRRRVWWALCQLDVRASEDQGTEFTIARGSFDTKLPLNINDADIDPKTTRTPTAREGLTDMTIPLVNYEMTEVMKQMMSLISKDGAPGIEEKDRLLSEIYKKLEQGYLQYTVESGNILYWVGVTIARLVMAKMTMFIYLPVLFSSPSENFSDEIKTKLLVAAIEIAEYNHALNEERACRQWRWVYQTYTHWYAVVYMLMEISRRPWSPICERAWIALHSPWLIPADSSIDKNVRIWIPFKKLTTKARRYRNAEIQRLRSDSLAVEKLEMEDHRSLAPASPGPFPPGSNVVEIFRERWRQLLLTSENLAYDRRILPSPDTRAAEQSRRNFAYTGQASATFITKPADGTDSPISMAKFEPTYTSNSDLQPDLTQIPNFSTLSSTANTIIQSPQVPPLPPNEFSIDQNSTQSYNSPPIPWSHNMGWLWADTDPSVDVFAGMEVDTNVRDGNMDLGSNSSSEVDWYNWAEAVKGMEGVWDNGGGRGGGEGRY